MVEQISWHKEQLSLPLLTAVRARIEAAPLSFKKARKITTDSLTVRPSPITQDAGRRTQVAPGTRKHEPAQQSVDHGLQFAHIDHERGQAGHRRDESFGRAA